MKKIIKFLIFGFCILSGFACGIKSKPLPPQSEDLTATDSFINQKSNSVSPTIQIKK